jgi:methyl-accepting chemotaxis protein
MESLRNLRLSVKLIGGFTMLALMILVGGLVGSYGVSAVSDDLKEVSRVRLPAIMGLDMMTEAKTALHRTERTVLLPEIAGSDAEKKRQADNIAKALGRADKGRKMYEALPKTKEEEALWNSLKPAWEAWLKDNQQVVDLAVAGRPLPTRRGRQGNPSMPWRNSWWSSSV